MMPSRREDVVRSEEEKADTIFLPALTPAQAARLPAFPGPGADLERMWTWAASTPLEEVPSRFGSSTYLRALRRAQGWAWAV